MDDLLSPELNVPLHEPSLQPPQPCDPAFDYGTKTFLTFQTTPTDSIHTARYNDDSQIRSLQASPSATQQENVDREAGSRFKQTVTAEQNHEQTSEAQAENGNHTKNGPQTNDHLTSTLPLDMIIEIQEEAGPSGLSSHQFTVHREDIHQGQNF